MCYSVKLTIYWSVLGAMATAFQKYSFFKVFLRTFVTAMGKEIIYAFMISKKLKSLSSQDDCQFIYAYAIPIAWIKLWTIYITYKLTNNLITSDSYTLIKLILLSMFENNNKLRRHCHQILKKNPNKNKKITKNQINNH